MSRIFSLFLAIFLTAATFSHAAETVNYLVENVAVNVTSKSPSGARNAAVATARRDAFLILLTRLGRHTNIADNITNDEISDMVRSEQIDGERIAGNSYSATFNIMFAQDFVEHILAQKDAPILDAKNAAIPKTEETYLVIPAQTVKRKTILWEENNDWRKAIAKNLSQKSSKKFIIPEADVANISVLDRDNVALVDYVGLEPILSRYKSDAAYTLFFNYDEIENKVSINVFYIRKLQKKQIKLSFVNVDRLDYAALLDKVAAKTIDYLLSSQTSENKILSSNLVRIGIPISSLGNWLMVKNKIENSNLVSQLNIESLSRDYALISVNYVNATVSIEEAFAKIGITLNKKSEDFYTLTIN